MKNVPNLIRNKSHNPRKTCFTIQPHVWGQTAEMFIQHYRNQSKLPVGSHVQQNLVDKLYLHMFSQAQSAATGTIQIYYRTVRLKKHPGSNSFVCCGDGPGTAELPSSSGRVRASTSSVTGGKNKCSTDECPKCALYPASVLSRLFLHPTVSTFWCFRCQIPLYLKFSEWFFLFKSKFSVLNTYLESLEGDWEGTTTKPLCPDHYLKSLRGFVL